MQWKWGYDYLKGEGEGIGFISTLDSGATRNVQQWPGPRPARWWMITCLKVDHPLGGPGQYENPGHHHGQ